MSGGHFDYAYVRTRAFADDLNDELDAGNPDAFSEETLLRLREMAQLVEFASKLMKEAEWLYSGDTTEESFHSRVDAFCEELQSKGLI